MKTKVTIMAVIAAASFYGGYKAADVNITKSVGIEKEIVEKDGETRTIYRVHRKKERIVQKDNRKWTARLLAEPSRPQNYELGVGYRVFQNISVEGAYKPSEGKVMIGLGVMF